MASSWSRLAALRRRLPLERQVLFPSRSYPHYTAPVPGRLFSSKSHRNAPTLQAFQLRLEDVLTDSWLIPRKGTGFDNFIPKNRKEKKEAEDQKAQKDSNEPEGGGDPEKPKKKGSDSDGFGPFRSQNDGGDKGGGGSGGPNFSGVMGSAILLALTYVILKDGDETPAESASREISWGDFCKHLLETGQVEKIVVTNNHTMAKVFLKPGARGLPQHQARNFRYSERRQQGGASESNFEEASGDGFTSGASTTDTFSTDSTSRSQTQHQIVYRFAIGSIDSFEKKLEEAQKAMGMDSSQDIPVQYTSDSTMASEIMGVVPSLLMMGAAVLLFRYAAGSMGGGGAGGKSGGGGMGGMFQVGKSPAKKIASEDVKIDFSDVAGCREAKKEVMEFVDFLQDPSRFTKLGAKIPKGALLCGPPGTGKTLLAKAVAGEAGVPFYSISGSDFIEMFVGVGPSRVRDLFKEARQNTPCIVFIDEIDAVGKKRGGGGASGGNDERENTLNQLLVEMDGFEESTGVVVLAATNRADTLDQALTRPGRFDRQIVVDKPDLLGRKEIFQVHLQGITLEDPIADIAGRLAGLTPGFAGADIANICNEAAIVAARREGESVTMADFEKATDRIIGGLESNKIMSLEERSIVAHHEAGHAIAGWFLEHADPLMKVTIIPRTSGALGFAQYLPKEVFLRTQDQIMDIVVMALAGRAAEEIFFGGVTTGASDDLRRVTDLVYSTIQLYGMNPRLGQLAFPKDPDAMFDVQPYSQKTAKAMDEEAKDIVDAAYKRSLELLREHKMDVEKVAKLLLDKETITHDDIVDIVGPRPFQGDSAYQDFVSRRSKVKQELVGDDAVEESEKPSEESGTLTPGLAFRA